MNQRITSSDLKQELHQCLSNLPEFSQCALLDYQPHRNSGDQFIWTGNVFYLSEVKKAEIVYTSTTLNFNESALEGTLMPEMPILLSGGGNFGDVWPHYQMFREKIIKTYPNHPIVILPQTIYFKELENLKRCADILNQHPNLTLFARDNVSYSIAIEHFTRCRIFKSPDTAFQLVNHFAHLSPSVIPKQSSDRKILYLSRTDKEKSSDSAIALQGLGDVTVADWSAFRRKVSFEELFIYNHEYQDGFKELSLLDRLIVMRRILWEAQQKGTSEFQYWLSYFRWQSLHPSLRYLQEQSGYPMHRRSWSFLHNETQFLQPYDVVITDRLHCHILCILLGIPHLFLANSYYKNKSFYDTWTSGIPFCRFVENPSEIAASLNDLLR